MDNLSKLPEMLETLMSEFDLSIERLAENIGATPHTIYRYLNAEVTPSVEKIIKMADCFSCTIDFLLGRERENYGQVFLPCPPFAEQLKALKEHFNCPWWDFYKKSDVSPSRFYEWKNGKRIPTLYNVITLAEAFDCSVDFILGRTEF